MRREDLQLGRLVWIDNTNAGLIEAIGDDTCEVSVENGTTRLVHPHRFTLPNQLYVQVESPAPNLEIEFIHKLEILLKDVFGLTPHLVEVPQGVRFEVDTVLPELSAEIEGLGGMLMISALYNKSQISLQ